MGYMTGREQRDNQIERYIKIDEDRWGRVDQSNHALIQAFLERFPALQPHVTAFTVKDAQLIALDMEHEDIELRREESGWEIYVGEQCTQMTADKFAEWLRLLQSLLDALRQLNESD